MLHGFYKIKLGARCSDALTGAILTYYKHGILCMLKLTFGHFKVKIFQSVPKSISFVQCSKGPCKKLWKATWKQMRSLFVSYLLPCQIQGEISYSSSCHTPTFSFRKSELLKELVVQSLTVNDSSKTQKIFHCPCVSLVFIQSLLTLCLSS